MTVMTGVAGFLGRVRVIHSDSQRSDGELVSEYVSLRNEDSFAELARRFAPMVWAVCRRTVMDRHAAEDAFQAVFLVLVRKIETVRPASAIGGWLHGVAVNTSIRVRTMLDRRRRKQSPLDPDLAGATPKTIDWDELQILDEEIARLPQLLRTAVVLCELGGVSRRDAAQRLAIAEGTLSSRLASARKQLAARLRSRGVTLPSAGLGVVLASGVAETAPTVLARPTQTISALADGVIRTMYLSKLTRLTAGFLLALTLLGVGLSAYPGEASESRSGIPAIRRNAPIPAVKVREGVIAIGIHENAAMRVEIRSPKGDLLSTIKLPPHPMYTPVLSRDGKRLALWAWDSLRVDLPNRAPNGMITHTGTLLVYDVEKPDTPLIKLENVSSGGTVFTPDGKRMYVNEMAEPDPDKERESTFYLLDLKTLKKEKLKLPTNHLIADVSPDGKTLLTTSSGAPTKGQFHVVTNLVPLSTLKPELISKESVAGTRFSPNGKSVLGRKFLDKNDLRKQELVILDVATQKEISVKLGDDTLMVWNAAWSPDGKQIVVHRDVCTSDAKEFPPHAPQPAGGGAVFALPSPQKPEVSIRNLDGSNPKVIVDLKSETHIFGIDWR